VHAQLVEIGACLHHDIKQMRYGRALVAANVGHARLQQGLGNRQYALPMEGLPVAEFEIFDLSAEGHFHCDLPFLFTALI